MSLNIAIVGANSHIGPHIIHALESSTNPTPFTLTILQRTTSAPPPTTKPARIITLPIDLSDSAALVSALQGVHALVCAVPGSVVDLQLRLADACIKAGVKRFIPADYGSVDSSDPVVAELVPLYRQKTKVREHLVELAERHKGKFSWTSLVCGHFFDHGLTTQLLGFNIKNGSVEVFDGGDLEWSASTLEQIARAVVAVLRKPGEETENKMLYMQSFSTSQNEVAAAVEKARGGKKLKVVEVDSKEYIEKMKKKMAEGDKEATEQMVCVLGITRADWTKKEGFAMGLLGLEDEDLYEIVKSVVDKI